MIRFEIPYLPLIKEKNMQRKFLTPVKPTGFEIIFLYPCPFCVRNVPLLAPTEPSMGQCDVCQKQFPLVPVDEKPIMFMKTILDNGRAAIDPDYL